MGRQERAKLQAAPLPSHRSLIYARGEREREGEREGERESERGRERGREREKEEKNTHTHTYTHIQLLRIGSSSIHIFSKPTHTFIQIYIYI